MREIIYDTETTGKRYQDGHRVVEIAAIELEDGIFTGRTFHTLINPQRSMPEDVIKIHGITDAMVANAPLFRQVMNDFLEFVRGAKVVAHNGEFDEKFLDNEMKLAGHPESFWAVVGETADTLPLSRKIWVGKDETGKEYRHNLDAILDRCGIDRSERTKHGALIDSELLAKAYLHMKGLLAQMGPTLEDDAPRAPIKRVVRTGLLAALPMVEVSEAQRAAHHALMDSIHPKETPKAAAPKM